jgi:hypothetical protein
LTIGLRQRRGILSPSLPARCYHEITPKSVAHEQCRCCVRFGQNTIRSPLFCSVSYRMNRPSGIRLVRAPNRRMYCVVSLDSVKGHIARSVSVQGKSGESSMPIARELHDASVESRGWIVNATPISSLLRLSGGGGPYGYAPRGQGNCVSSAAMASAVVCRSAARKGTPLVDIGI